MLLTITRDFICRHIIYSTYVQYTLKTKQRIDKKKIRNKFYKNIRCSLLNFVFCSSFEDVSYSNTYTYLRYVRFFIQYIHKYC